MTRPSIFDESGQAAALVVVCMLGLLALTALVIDGGVLFSAKRNIQSLADGAARAGAMQIDEEKLRDGGENVELNPEAARHAAEEYLERSGFAGNAEIAADVASTNVELAQSQETVLLGLVGIRSVDADARAVAGPRTGGSG